MRIAINGMGIAGPALAWWLHRDGHDVLLLEEAPRLRTGGYIIDFWGLGYELAERMGILPRVKELGYQVREVRFLDRDGRRASGFSTEVFTRLTGGRFTSLRRSDLGAAIYQALDPAVERLFDNSISGIHDTGTAVRIELARGGTREVDLVVGADGLHSAVRRLVFGPQSRFEVPLGYHVAAAEVRGYRPRDELVYVSYTAPGRQLSRFAMRDDRTLLLFVFRDECLGDSHPEGDGERRAALARIYRDLGREAAPVFDALDGAEDIYFDRVSQIRMPEWCRGRVALLGDAAACVSLMAGEGSGLAMAEAYVLAGELGRAAGDHTIAFARYQALLRPFLQKKQESARKFASAFAPKTAIGVEFRNLVTRLLRIPALADWLVGRDLRDDITLPNYASARGAPVTYPVESPPRA